VAGSVVVFLVAFTAIVVIQAVIAQMTVFIVHLSIPNLLLA
jgi:hypothetical protein